LSGRTTTQPAERGDSEKCSWPFARGLLDHDSPPSNAEGLPVGAAITAGEAHDLKGSEALRAETAPDPKVLLADRGYDAAAVRADVELRVPIIPTKKNRQVPSEIDRAIYALRKRIERCFNRRKNARRVATRYDQLAATFLSFVQLTAIRLWLRHFVNRT